MFKTNEDPGCSNLTMLDQTSHHITTMHLTPASRAQSYTNNNSALDNMHTAVHMSKYRKGCHLRRCLASVPPHHLHWPCFRVAGYCTGSLPKDDTKHHT